MTKGKESNDIAKNIKPMAIKMIPALYDSVCSFIEIVLFWTGFKRLF